MVRLKYFLGVVIIGFLLVYLLIFMSRRLLLIKEGNVKITVKYKARKAEDLTIYWDDGAHFSQDKHKTQTTDTTANEYTFEIRQPRVMAKVRIDPADTFSTAIIYNVSISGTKIPYSINRFDTFQTSGLSVVKLGDGYLLKRESNNFDPWMMINIPIENTCVFSSYSMMDKIIIVFCFLITFFVLFTLVKRKIWFKFLHETFFTKQILIIGFTFIITSYWTVTIFEYYTPPASIENRRLAGKPKLDTIKYNPNYFFNEFNSWFTDYFPFRQKLVHCNSLLRIGLFNVSPMPDELVIGNNSEFFTANSFVLDDFIGKKTFSENELNIMDYAIQTKRKYCKEHNIIFYLIIPPNKQTIYHNFMPYFYQAQEGNLKLLQQVRNRLMLDSAKFYIDVADSLNDYFTQHPEKRVFYKYDLHWSEWGAFKGYQVLMNRIYKDHPEYGRPLRDDEVKIDTVYDDQADLAKLIVMNQKFKREKYLITPLKKDSISETTENYSFAPIYIYRNPGGTGRILVFRDSYSEQWKLLIAHHFKESIFIWDHKMSAKMIEKYKPDIVLQENSEMLLLYLFENILTGDNA